MTELRKSILAIPRKLASFVAGKGLGKLPLVTWLNSYFYYYLKPDGVILIDVQGSKMYVDSRDVGVAPFLLEWGVYEKYVTELLKKLIKEGMVVVDIGANIGYYTLLAARSIGEKGKVFAFEPDSYNYSLLSKNIEVNGFRNVILVQKAVFSESGRMELFLDKNNLGSHSLSEANVNKGASVTVEVTSLDDYFKDIHCKIDVIKIDVQGSEIGVLEGMKNIINQNDDLRIITEFWPSGLRKAGYSPTYFLNKLIEYGFVFYQIGHHIEPITINQLLKKCGNKKFTTLLCTKKSARYSV